MYQFKDWYMKPIKYSAKLGCQHDNIYAKDIERSIGI